VHNPNPAAELQRLNRLGQKVDPPLQRLDQVDLQVRPANGKHQAGQPSPAADIDDPRACRQQIRQYSAIQQMTVPQTVNFARPDQTATRPLGPQQIVKPIGLGQRRPEYRPGLRRDIVTDRQG